MSSLGEQYKFIHSFIGNHFGCGTDAHSRWVSSLEPWKNSFCCSFLPINKTHSFYRTECIMECSVHWWICSSCCETKPEFVCVRVRAPSKQNLFLGHCICAGEYMIYWRVSSVSVVASAWYQWGTCASDKQSLDNMDPKWMFLLVVMVMIVRLFRAFLPCSHNW